MTSESAGQNLPDAVVAWLQTVADTVRERNATYGDSACDPVRVFASSAPDEQLRVRIDDKLSRVARGAGATPDTLVDLVGYIAILAVMQQRSAGSVASQVSLPYVEDATLPPPQRTPAPDATACLRPGRADPRGRPPPRGAPRPRADFRAGPPAGDPEPGVGGAGCGLAGCARADHQEGASA